MNTINPATGAIIGEARMFTGAERESRVSLAHTAFAEWRSASFGDRAELFRGAAALLKERAADYARLMAVEMGKPVKEGRAEPEKCAWVCEYYADHAEAFLAPRDMPSDAARSYVAYKPLGVILSIMPWNFPFWQVLRFAAPSLMAGNVTLMKHAPNVPACAEAVETLFLDAGFPAGVLTNFRVSNEHTAQAILDPRVAAVTLTGSTRAGREVASVAGAGLKKTVLELGGSDPYVILDDADLDLALDACFTSRMINSGQSCVAAKRFIVTERNRAAFEAGFVERMQRVVMGDPMDEATHLGPLARADLRGNLHRQVMESILNGARVLLGAEPPGDPGFYYPPTVLTDVAPEMPAYSEELFGPVAAILPVEDEEEAIRVANDTSYGLGAAVFTTDPARGEAIARDRLSAGCCFVNAFVKSDPRLPFGGIRDSGYGRELGDAGIREFVNAKTVYVA